MIHLTHNEIETKLLGQKFATKLKGGTVLLLSGNLGSGKTTFIKGLGERLGIKKIIRSPSFTLLNQYRLPKNSLAKLFIHLDCYRLHSEQEIIDLGLFDFLGQKDIIIAIEWPEKIKQILKPFKPKEIKFHHLRENLRKIIL